jgi:peptide/nickel transport system permease protein
VIFAATEVLPGDAARQILGRNATPQALHALRAQLHLDTSAYQGYWRWLSGVLHGDLGTSLTTGVSVSSLIDSRVTNTFILAGVTAAILIPLSIVLGTLAGSRSQSPIDRAIDLPALVAISLPEFVTGAILITAFGTWLGWLPPVSIVLVGVNPLTTPKVLVLPVLTLLAGSVAQTTRMVRAGVIDVRSSEYVEMARLKGVPESQVLVRHVLRNALVPAIQVFALNLQWLIGGVVITEVLFDYPGMGQGLVAAVGGRDIPVIQAITLVIAVSYVVLNIVADVVVVLLTPSLRDAPR